MKDSPLQPMPRRPGDINRARGGWRPACHWCGWNGLRLTYQEASIALTHHLDHEHVGWEERHIVRLTDGEDQNQTTR